MNPCDLHEVSNCALCSGAAKRFDASIASEPLQEYGDDVLPIIPGAVVIRAQYGGTCGTCGRRWHPGAAIFRSRLADVGWQGYKCCS